MIQIIKLFHSFAEKVGFEPTIPLRVYHLSRVASSTTRAPLRCVERNLIMRGNCKTHFNNSAGN